MGQENRRIIRHPTLPPRIQGRGGIDSQTFLERQPRRRVGLWSSYRVNLEKLWEEHNNNNLLHFHLDAAERAILEVAVMHPQPIEGGARLLGGLVQRCHPSLVWGAVHKAVQAEAAAVQVPTIELMDHHFLAAEVMCLLSPSEIELAQPVIHPNKQHGPETQQIAMAIPST